VVEGPAGMRFHFVRAPESGQDGQHDDAAFAHREPAFATPACAPAVLVEHLLQRTAEVGGVVESGVHVLRAEHLAADRLAARRKLLAGLVGHSIASCAKKGWESASGVCAAPGRPSTNPPARLRPVHYSTPKGGRAGGFPHTDGTAGLNICTFRSLLTPKVAGMKTRSGKPGTPGAGIDRRTFMSSVALAGMGVAGLGAAEPARSEVLFPAGGAGMGGMGGAFGGGGSVGGGVHRSENNLFDCEVEGKLPADLSGIFFRIGPDPQYPKPAKYMHDIAFDGEGHISAFHIQNGHVDFRSRYVQTQRW